MSADPDAEGKYGAIDEMLEKRRVPDPDKFPDKSDETDELAKNDLEDEEIERERREFEAMFPSAPAPRLPGEVTDAQTKKIAEENVAAAKEAFEDEWEEEPTKVDKKPLFPDPLSDW